MADIKISELSSASVLQDNDSVELSQDISGTLISTKASLLALANKFASDVNYSSELKTDDKTLTGAINEKVGWKENAFLGAKNLNSTPYYHTSRTINYVTWTINDDGSVTANGTASGGNSNFACHSRNIETNKLVLPNGKYILSGCATGGSSSTWEMALERTHNGSAETIVVNQSGDTEFTLNGDDYSADSVQVQLILRVRNNQQANNITFYPMIRLANDSDDNWQPYVPTNRDLFLSKPNPGSIAPEEYSPARSNHSQGDFIIFNGNMYKCLSAITSGSALVVGTNIQETNVVSEMGSGSGSTLISGTLVAGATSITLSDASITTDSWINPYSSVYGVNPTGISVSTGSVTLTFQAQLTDIVVGVEVK